MNKFTMNLVAVMAAVLVIATIAIAGSVYDRDTATLATKTGSGVWTNNYKYSAILLKNIWVQGDLAALNTVTVSRVTSDGVYTQAVGTVTVAGNIGNTTSFTESYMKSGDVLTFTSTQTTGGVALIDFEVQQH